MDQEAIIAARINKIHASYIVGILLGIVVLLTAILLDFWKVQPHAIDLAGTLTAILLAVVSIFYAFISTDGISRDLSNIRSSAERVGSAAAEVNDAAARVGSSSKELKTAAEEILSSVTTVLQRTSAEVKESVTTALNANVASAKSTTPPPSLNPEIIRRFFNSVSPAGRVTLYGLHRAATRNTSLKFKPFARAWRSAPNATGSYEFGFSVAAAGAGILECKGVVGSSVKPIQIRWPEDTDVREWLRESLNTKKRSQDAIEKWLKAVDEYVDALAPDDEAVVENPQSAPE